VVLGTARLFAVCTMHTRLDSSIMIEGAGAHHDGALCGEFWAHTKRKTPISRAIVKSAARALFFLLFTTGFEGAVSVTCDICKDTIAGCKGGTDCPLVKGPISNAASLTAASTSKAPDLTHLLPTDMLCTFSRPVIQTLNAVAKAPKGGGPMDLTVGAIAKVTDVVRMAVDGFCSWEDAGLELATRLEAAKDEGEIAKVSAALATEGSRLVSPRMGVNRR
jgi:hypothetical protein